MTPREFKNLRQEQLGLTQAQLAERLRTTRMTITRYECGMRRIPGVVKVALHHLAASSQLPMAGIVAAGNPIEPIPQTELVDVPPSMARGGENFALRVKGESMPARNGQTVVALVNQEATIKKYYRKAGRIELHPANAAMKPIIVTSEDEFKIEGIVIGLIRYCE